MSLYEGKNFSKFRPIFKICDLGRVCLFQSEKSEIKFIWNYWPFRFYKPAAKSCKRFSIEPEYEKLIRKEWENKLTVGDLSFNDDKVFEKVMDKIREDYELNLLEDSDWLKPSKKFKISSDENLEPNKIENKEQLLKETVDEWLNEYKPLVRTSVALTRGKVLEKSIMEDFNKTKNFNFIPINKNNELEFDLFKICGRPDGIDFEKNILIEVKTRNFINQEQVTVKPCEKIQCLSYMKLFNIQKCILVESNNKGEQNNIDINWDETEYEEIVLSKLRCLVQKYRNMTISEFEDKIKKYSDC